jgi:hypothetical protein
MEQRAPGAAFQLILLAAFLIPAIFFLLSQQNTLKAVSPAHRRMIPGLVWLQVVPILGQIWSFVVVTRIASSIRKGLASEFEHTIFGADAASAQKGASQWPTLGLGIAWCIPEIFIIAYNLFGPVNSQPSELIGLLALGTMVCWIIYWVQLVQYKNKLKRVQVAG